MMREAIAKRLKAKEKLSVRQIRQFFQERDDWDEDYSMLLAHRALDMGENFLAYDIAEQIQVQVDTFKDRIHIMALALARSGSLKHANELIKLLPDSNDSEVMGLKSRILKDFALNSTVREQRRDYFLRAGQLSLDIFNSLQQYYNGINAASCLLMAGSKEQARALVRKQVLPLCSQESEHDMWWHATMGECHLLLEDYDSASNYYRTAAQIAIQNGALGNLTSTLKQLYMLSEALDHKQIDQIVAQMDLPSIAVFSGHLIDRPERKIPRFPAYAEEQVRTGLAEIIRRRGIRIAYVSCACGGDIIFAEEVLRYGGECLLFPSLPIESEIRNSVDVIPGANWKERLEALMHHENTTVHESECDEIGEKDDSIVYDFTNRLLFGSALSKARELHFPLCGVAVWNLEKSGLTGGTDSAVALWQAHNIPIDIVTPEVRQ